jgi:hypothetical protein
MVLCVGESVLYQKYREYNAQAVSLARGPHASNGLPNSGAIPNPRDVGLIGDFRGVTRGDKAFDFIADDNPCAGQLHHRAVRLLVDIKLLPWT